MNRTAKVMIREKKVFKSVPITDSDKPEILEVISQKWQRIVDLCARLLGTSSGLIMRITEENAEVFLKSTNSENPYSAKGIDMLGNGLYCETVIGTNQELLVENALGDPTWAGNPDVKHGMISYYGLPIQWPDKQMFGTICVLDNKPHTYNETFKKLLLEFKLSIEADLELLENKKHLTLLAERDPLTSLLNRRRISEILTMEHERSFRYKTPLGIAMMDLDKFKQVNDKYGHDVGDQVLKKFADSISSRIRNIDIFGRWGGDEFLLVCPNTDCSGVTTLLADIGQLVTREIRKIADEVGFSYGIAESDPVETSGSTELLKRADKALYEAKRKVY